MAEAKVEWRVLLDEALTAPGNLTGVYDRFHDYSLTNMLLFRLQGIHEPVDSSSRWKALGRQVLRGVKAREVVVPVFIKERLSEPDESDVVRKEATARLIGFKVVRAVFALSDTNGPEPPPMRLQGWDLPTALDTLGIRQIPFDHTNGNVQGYSRGVEIAINPVAVRPAKTLMHELGHVVLGHTLPHALDDYVTHRGIKEFQAEAVAYLAMNELEQLDEEVATASRGYIQFWLQEEQPPDKAIQQVFAATDRILRAGRLVASHSADG